TRSPCPTWSPAPYASSATPTHPMTMSSDVLPLLRSGTDPGTLTRVRRQPWPGRRRGTGAVQDPPLRGGPARGTAWRRAEPGDQGPVTSGNQLREVRRMRTAEAADSSSFQPNPARLQCTADGPGCSPVRTRHWSRLSRYPAFERWLALSLALAAH